jgi:hypothetical protein
VLQYTTDSYFSSPNATQGCKTRQVRPGPVSGPLSVPSGSPRSPAEPHPPSLAWVETPLPLGPLPPPPGPLNAKHCKRAQGAVFNGTHSPVRSEPSSPPPGSPQRGGGHPAIAPGAVLHVRSRRVTTSFCAVGAKLRAVPLAKSPPNFRPQAEVGAEGNGRPLHTQLCTPRTFFTFCFAGEHKNGTLGAWHKRCKTKRLRGCV